MLEIITILLEGKGVNQQVLIRFFPRLYMLR